MSKLTAEAKFIDLSDYGRSPARLFAGRLKHTRVTPIHLTCLFGVSGLLAIWCIFAGHNLMAAVFLVIKSVIDAADGELSRIKKTPSYSGRYLDSIFDIILNFLFVMAIGLVSNNGLTLTLLSFLCIQLQGTLYNYYYVIVRNNTLGSDTTSKVFEHTPPTALPGESQRSVDFLFRTFRLLYVFFDKAIYLLDRRAQRMAVFPKWFMTLLSIYGLGFQLLLMAMMLAVGWIEWIVPFFVGYSFFIFVFVGLRRRLGGGMPAL